MTPEVKGNVVGEIVDIMPWIPMRKTVIMSMVKNVRTLNMFNTFQTSLFAFFFF